MEAQLVVKKSAWTAVSIWRVLFFWLIIPLIKMICGIISSKCTSVSFYDSYYVIREGVFSRREKKVAFENVLAVEVEQSLWGRMCGYGTLHLDVAGRHDVAIEGICKIKEVKSYLDNRVSAKGTNAVIVG